MWLFGVWMVSQPAEAQFSGAAVYELGIATTDVGEDQGQREPGVRFRCGRHLLLLLREQRWTRGGG